jgi:hypothetical protein
LAHFFKRRSNSQPLLSTVGCHPYPASSRKSVPNCHYYLQQAVTPDWIGSIFFNGGETLGGYNTAFIFDEYEMVITLPSF